MTTFSATSYYKCISLRLFVYNIKEFSIIQQIIKNNIHLPLQGNTTVSF